MLAALALLQTFCVRESIEDVLERPAVLRVLAVGQQDDDLVEVGRRRGRVERRRGDSVCQAICIPMVTLVLPVGVMASILALQRGPVGGQRHHRRRAGRRLMRAVLGRARRSPARCCSTSLFWSRSFTQPFQVLWFFGVQVLAVATAAALVVVVVACCMCRLLRPSRSQSIQDALTFRCRH